MEPFYNIRPGVNFKMLFPVTYRIIYPNVMPTVSIVKDIILGSNCNEGLYLIQTNQCYITNKKNRRTSPNLGYRKHVEVLAWSQM